MAKSLQLFIFNRFTLIQAAWAILCSYPSVYIASYLWLIRLYGYHRVSTEHLYFTSMAKGSPWLVSNGDAIKDGFFQNHFLVALPIWFALWITPMFILELRKALKLTPTTQSGTNSSPPG